LALIPTKGTASTDIGGIGKQKQPERLADGTSVCRCQDKVRIKPDPCGVALQRFPD